MEGVREMLLKVSPYQQGFNIPGLRFDERGVVVGEYVIILLASIDRVVSFLSGYTKKNSLNNIVDLFKIYKVTSTVRKSEFIIKFPANSSYAVDIISNIARVVGGVVFVGTVKHFVQYRDSGSPIGYDSELLEEMESDFVLYHHNFTEGYFVDKEIGLKSLILRLELWKSSNFEYNEEELLIRVREGLSQFVTGYLLRNRIKGALQVIEMVEESLFEEGHKLFYLYKIKNLPHRIFNLFLNLPGVTLYYVVKESNNIGVEVGYIHPLELTSVSAVFNAGELYLFNSGKRGVEIVPISSQWLELEQMRKVNFIKERDRVTFLEKGDRIKIEPIKIDMRLVRTSKIHTNIIGTIIEWQDVEKLKKLIYFLPPLLFKEASISFLKEFIIIIAPNNIDSIPLGTPLYHYGNNILVTLGYTFQPKVSSEFIKELISLEEDEYVIFHPEAPPYRFSKSNLYPITKAIINSIEVRKGEQLELSPHSFELKEIYLHNKGLPIFPLWGIKREMKE